MRYAIELIKKKQSNAVEPVTGKWFIDALNYFKTEIIYDDKNYEHVFYMTNKNGDPSDPSNSIVYYPTLYSIQKRIELAEELGTGLSIWELGQGLDYFYDLL